jgi:hypothetical protein
MKYSLDKTVILPEPVEVSFPGKTRTLPQNYIFQGIELFMAEQGTAKDSLEKGSGYLLYFGSILPFRPSPPNYYRTVFALMPNYEIDATLLAAEPGFVEMRIKAILGTLNKYEPRYPTRANPSENKEVTLTQVREPNNVSGHVFSVLMKNPGILFRDLLSE